jgi:hypothetical protein
VNPLWAQPNLTGIPPQGTIPYQYVNPTIPMQQSLPPPYIGGPLRQFQYVGGPSAPSQYMGGQLGQPSYMGGQPGKPWLWEDHLVFSSCQNLDMVLLVFPRNMVITSINKLTKSYRSWLC